MSSWRHCWRPVEVARTPAQPLAPPTPRPGQQRQQPGQLQQQPAARTQQRQRPEAWKSSSPLPKQKARLTTIALPHDWCDYGAVIDGFKAKYGLEVNELDPGAGSAEELEAIDANKDNPGPQAPDVIDVGLAFGPQAKEEGLIQPYKVSTWDDIPEGAKDADGYWYGDYYGVLSFEVNTAEVANPPAEYADLLKPEYNGQIALSGDPLTSNAAILSVWAAGLATGATGEEAAQAGLEFFKPAQRGRQLRADRRRLPHGWDRGDPDPDRLVVQLDRQRCGPCRQPRYRDRRAGGRPAWRVCMCRRSAPIAPHPNAAKLWMEYLYSDEGQLGWASGFCHPIRFDAMIGRRHHPAEVSAQLPSTEGAFFPTIDEINAAREVIVAGWPEVVGVTVDGRAPAASHEIVDRNRGGRPAPPTLPPWALARRPSFLRLLRPVPDRADVDPRLPQPGRRRRQASPSTTIAARR